MLRNRIVSIALLAALFAGMFFISSCCQKKVYCSPGYMEIGFIGFNRTEINNMILRRLPKDSQGAAPIDTAVFLFTGTYPTKTTPDQVDTVYFSDYTSKGALQGIYAGFDWVLYIPGTQRYYAITTIFNDDKQDVIVKCTDKETTCTSEIKNYSINGLWQDGRTLYIRKEN